MDDQQERQLVEGLREGKTEAWRALYDAYARPLWLSVARAMGPNQADVADVVQETLLAAARSAPGFDPARGSFWLWLSGIARKHVALHYRKEQRHDRVRQIAGPAAVGEQHRILRWLDSGEPMADDVLASAEVGSLVRAALAELPIDYQTVLTAKYLDGVSVEDIARSEACSVTAMRSRLARARRAFRRAFERKDPS